MLAGLKEKRNATDIRKWLASLRGTLPKDRAAIEEIRGETIDRLADVLESLDTIKMQLREGGLDLPPDRYEALKVEQRELNELESELDNVVTQLEFKIEKAKAAEQRGEMEKLAATLVAGAKEQRDLCKKWAPLIGDLYKDACRFQELQETLHAGNQRLRDAGANDLCVKGLMGHPDLVATGRPRRNPFAELRKVIHPSLDGGFVTMSEMGEVKL